MLASAMLLGGLASASAAPLAYTFADTSGSAYCDGITLKLSDGIYVGTHTAGSECTEGDYAGGLPVKLKGTKDRIIDVVTTDTNNAPNYTETYVLDTVALTWALYALDTTDGVTYYLANSGELLTGAPDIARLRAPSKPYASSSRLNHR